MRRLKLAAAFAAVLVGAATAVVAAQPEVATAAAADPYTWKNVRIDGGSKVVDIIFD